MARGARAHLARDESFLAAETWERLQAPLEDQHFPAGGCQVRRTDQAVVACPYDDCVVLLQLKLSDSRLLLEFISFSPP